MALILGFKSRNWIPGVPMKRNKRTEKISNQNLSPLTEKILAKMGSEGAAIRRRLQLFYQTRDESGEGGVEQSYAAGRPQRT